MRLCLQSSIFLSFTIVALTGSCPRYPLIRDFNFERYMGMWYQQDKKQAGWEMPGRCWKTLFLKDPKTGQFKMRMIFENSITGREEKYDSKLTLAGPRRPSVIKYKIPFTFLEDKFQVLATDYDTFSVEYKCDSNGILEKQESVFLLTRAKSPDPLILQKAYTIMHRYGIDIRKLERVDQTCGGLEFSHIVLSPRLQAEEGSRTGGGDDETEYYDYYYPNPTQNIHDPHRLSESSNSQGQYDYFDSPSVVTARIRVAGGTKRRRPNLFRRRSTSTSVVPSSLKERRFIRLHSIHST